jgi:hypothetical protein
MSFLPVTLVNCKRHLVFPRKRNDPFSQLDALTTNLNENCVPKASLAEGEWIFELKEAKETIKILLR